MRSLLGKRRPRTLAQQMKAVDWAIQRIGADEAGLMLDGYTGPLPVVEPFAWLDSGWGTIVSWRPALNGEALSHQHLSAEQMAFCIEHLEQLEEWATAMRQLHDRVHAECEQQRQSDVQRRRRQAEDARQAYTADVAARLGG